MATERVTKRPDGTTERVIEQDEGLSPPSGVSSPMGVVVGLALLALVAIVGFFLLSQSRNDSLRTRAVTGVAHSVSSAARSGGDAVDPAAGR